MSIPSAYQIIIIDDIAEYSIGFEMYFPDDAILWSAATIDEAKVIFCKHAPLDLAIVDVRLREDDPADVGGLELLGWIREHHPDTPVIMMSAYQSFEFEAEAMERGALRFLRKPLQPALVKAAIQEGLAP